MSGYGFFLILDNVRSSPSVSSVCIVYERVRHYRRADVRGVAVAVVCRATGFLFEILFDVLLSNVFFFFFVFFIVFPVGRLRVRCPRQTGHLEVPKTKKKKTEK